MIGPKVTTQRSCFDCEVCVSESYRVQSDSGQDVYCTHPSLAERKRIGDTNWETPDWCPAAITAAPQFIAPKVDDAMCERVWDAVFRKVVSNEVMAELRHAALFLDAWRAELGPQLGLASADRIAELQTAITVRDTEIARLETDLELARAEVSRLDQRVDGLRSAIEHGQAIRAIDAARGGS